MVIGVNPDPGRWDGVLLPFKPADVGGVTREHLAERRPISEITMAQAQLNDGQTLYGVNDLFIGPRSHVSARYVIAVKGRQEQQSSSGIIVSTGLGSTGWLRSVYAGWVGMTRALNPSPWATEMEAPAGFDAQELRFCVREPFPSRSSQAGIVFGRIAGGASLTVTSLMPENGVIFSDGIEADSLSFNSGAIATVGVADRRGLLVT